MIPYISFLDSFKKPPFWIDGFEAEKKNKDLARRQK